MNVNKKSDSVKAIAFSQNKSSGTKNKNNDCKKVAKKKANGSKPNKKKKDTNKFEVRISIIDKSKGKGKKSK